jgi:hypothetical protein
VASSRFKSRVLNPVHLNQVLKKNKNKSNDEEDNVFQEAKEDVASNTWKSAEKHRLKKQYEYQYPNNTQHHYYHHAAQQKHYQHKRGSEPQSSKDHEKNTVATDSQSSSQSELSSSDDNARPRKVKIKASEAQHLFTTGTNIHQAKKPPPLSPKTEQILVTKKPTLNTKPSVAARTKDLRLKGSDLYVARLGNCKTSSKHSKDHPAPPIIPASPPSSPKSSPTSLYDELSLLSRTPSPPSYTPASSENPHKPEIRASRPCYRCVSAMHACGIKRVFWTNQDGEWEGAKVRDLVEALEGGGGEEASAGGEGAKVDRGVFVTKHEVLLLKRVMGF